MTAESNRLAAERMGSWPRLRMSGWSWVTVSIGLLIALPVLVVAAHILTPSGEIWGHLAQTVLPRYVADTLWLACGVGVGVVVIGVGTSWLVCTCEFPGRSVFEWSLLLPLALPAYVIAYIYTGLLDFAGPVQAGLRDLFGWEGGDYWFPSIRSFWGAIGVMALVLYPYVYLLSRAAFMSQSVCVLEVGRTLGCGPWRNFFRVALPMARPSIAAGLAFALMETLNDIGTVDFFGIDTFTRGVYRTWLDLRELNAAQQLAALLMICVLMLILLERWSRGRAHYYNTSTRTRPLRRYRLRGAKAFLAFMACALPLLLGFVVPFVAMAAWTPLVADRVIDERFWSLLGNSFILAASAAVLVTAVALLLAYGNRLDRGRITVFVTRIASMGYAVPGTIIAIGVLVPFAWLDSTVDSWMRSSFGVSTGLLLSGTVAALLFAYLVRFLAISFNSIEAGLTRVTPSMEAAARTLGHGPLSTLNRVHVPVIRGSIATAALLVFVDVMKELPATLILRPFNFDTLAVRTYEYAVDEQLVEAAPSALAIVLAGIVPVILLSRAITHSRPGQVAE